MSKSLISFSFVCGLVCSQAIWAEVITIPIGQQGAELKQLPRPSRGMSSAAVLQQFGEPMSMRAATGEPPISQWHYANFTVYFERDSVLHSVVRHAPKHPVE